MYDIEDSFDDIEESELVELTISSCVAKTNYDMAGVEVPEDNDQISIVKYAHLLNDYVHQYIHEVLLEIQLPYKLSDFQLLSLHVLGSNKNLLFPAGSGKTLVIYLGTLLLRKVFKVSEGVSVTTEPLNMIMAEKLCTSIIPIGVISMTGELKTSLEEQNGVQLSAPEESFLDGSLPCIFGHLESWMSEKGRQLIKELYKQKKLLMIVTDEMHCSLNWESIR